MLLHIAKRNKRKLSPEQINEIDVILDEVAASHDGEESKKLSVMHMFKRQYIFTTGILIIGWICTNLGYYRYSKYTIYTMIIRYNSQQYGEIW